MPNVQQKPVVDPCPPGQTGGRFKPLTQAEIERIFDTALQLLEHLGMGDVPDRLAADLRAAGAQDGTQDRLLFPREMVQRTINTAAKAFVFPRSGREPIHRRLVAIVSISEPVGRRFRRLIMRKWPLSARQPCTDLRDFTRLARHVLQNVSWFHSLLCSNRIVARTVYDLDVNTVYALVRKNTTKPTATSFTIAEHVATDC